MMKRLATDALIAPIIKNYDFSKDDQTLRDRFQEDYKEELNQLWELFLADVAMEKAIQEHPELQTKLEDTPLSGRAKNCLREADVKTVADITIYSLKELAYFRNMGKMTLKEIEDYVKEVLG